MSGGSTTEFMQFRPREYEGFEQGPIRPPSEAQSLLIRVTRNCPWNRCRFCGVYKDTRFSRRPVEDVLADIEAVASWVRVFESGDAGGNAVCQLDPRAEQAAWNWYRRGMKSVFLQDANPLAMPPAGLIAVLRALKERFPSIERVTTYARSKTIARLDPNDLAEMRAAGLDRVHVGFETGSDEILRFMDKGVTKEEQIVAGRMIKEAGLELSAYYMPGLGGRDRWRENAVETADLMNQVNPDFIRLRTLAVPDNILLAEDAREGRFDKAGDVEGVLEILMFIENLAGITSVIVSDHILNLLQDLEGRLPEDRDRMVAELRAFLAFSPGEQLLYRIGRRRGLFAGLADFGDPRGRSRAVRLCAELGANLDNVDEITNQLVKRFV